MRTLFLSDAHLTGLDDPSQLDLVRWLDRVEDARVVLLGDIFHAWWGFPGVVWEGYIPICAALLRASRRGVRLLFVPGNHDFAVGSFLEHQVGLQVAGAQVLEVQGRRFLLRHGDEVDLSLGYRLASGALRGPAMAALMRVLGPHRGQQLLLRLAGSSRAHGADSTPMLDRQRRWADHRLGVSADVVVMGHVHIPCLEQRRAGVFVNLGDWAQRRTWLEVDRQVLSMRLGVEGELLTELPLPVNEAGGGR